MAENTGIAWTDATFNPWWGCTKVSPGCDHCYAERDSKRYGFDVWGLGKQRRTFGEKHWNEPRRWDRAAAKAGVRKRVFCASMADVFDNDAPEGEREKLWTLIRETPNLDWLLLTKRIGNAAKMLPADWGDGWRNVWIGATMVNQEELDRDGPKLVAVPAVVRFISHEPGLGPISNVPAGIHWIITGGESGPGARPFGLNWARNISRLCQMDGMACFVKQLGARPFDEDVEYLEGLPVAVSSRDVLLRDRKGGNPDEWPADLRVREFPSPQGGGR